MSRFAWPSVVLLVISGLSPAVAKRADGVQPQRYLEHVKYLAAPELQGRGAGTAGLERASKYIADQFKQFKLQPAGENGTYWQDFRVTTSAKPGDGNHLKAADTNLRLHTDYIPISFSSNGRIEAPVVFAGYGITAPEFQHDDYTHLDVKDKVVLILRYEPNISRKRAKGKREPTRTTHTWSQRRSTPAITALKQSF